MSRISMLNITKMLGFSCFLKLNTRKWRIYNLTALLFPLQAKAYLQYIEYENIQKVYFYLFGNKYARDECFK